MITYQVARSYIDRGYSIFPVILASRGGKFEKKPAVLWKEYQTRLATDEELHKWFDKPNYNALGLATGALSGVVIVDIESDATPEDKNRWQSPQVTQTISDGLHLWYKWTKPLTNTVKIEQKALDFRGDGGFIVIPPSACEGKSYKFLRHCDKTLLPPLPESFEQLLVDRRKDADEPFQLSEVLSQEQGSRNDILFRYARSQFARHYHEEEVFMALELVNRTFNPPCTMGELLKIFNSAKKYINEEPEVKPGDEKKVMSKEPVVWNKIEAPSEQEDWLWENYIARGHVTLLSALWKAGKSTLIRALLVAMSRNEEFAGQPTKKINVFVLTEETESDWAESRDDFGAEEIDNVYLSIRSIRSKPNLKDWKALIKEIKEEVIAKNIDLVIIDTISVFMPIVHENDAGEWMPALVPLWDLTDGIECKCAVVLVHHFSKEGGTEGRASRGSGTLPGFVSNIIEFRRVDGDAQGTQRKLTTYGRFTHITPEIIIDFNADTYRYETLGNTYEVSKGAKLNRIVKILEGNKAGITVQEIHTLWDESRYGKSPVKRSIRNYMTDLVNCGKAFVVKDTLVGKKKTPVYALKEGWSEQTTLTGENSPLLDTVGFPFLSKKNNSGKSEKTPFRSNMQNEATTEERKDVGLDRENIKEDNSFDLEIG